MTNQEIKVGDIVKFKDYFGEDKVGIVTALLPIGSFSPILPSVAIEGVIGDFLRTIDQIERRKCGIE